VVRTIERGLADLRQDKRMEPPDGVTLSEFEQIVDVPRWAAMEKRFGARP
jgi:hypothetical protein